MQAARETLGVGVILSLIVLYFIIFENQFLTFVWASDRKSVMESMELANMWGPCIMADSILSVDRYGHSWQYIPHYKTIVEEFFQNSELCMCMATWVPACLFYIWYLAPLV